MSTLRKQILTLAMVALLASTLLMEVSFSSAHSKKKILKAAAVAAMVLKHIKPKKGILPIPLPLPVPLPIEWEQPPVIVHPKQYHPEPQYGGYG